MIICSVQKLSKTYNEKLFDQVTFEINDGETIGLVGRNGTGKTTIFKMLTGLEQPDEGAIFIKKDARIGYLTQIPEYPNGETVSEVLRKAFEEVLVLEKRMIALEKSISSEKDHNKLETLLSEYGLVQDKFISSGGYEIDAEIDKVANGLGINNLLDKQFNLLSGGEKTKVSIGVILLTKPDLLLLDEPTNHLDIFAVEWLEGFLKLYANAVIVISHDRYFLDKVVNKIYDIDDGELTIYHGNYSNFVKEKEERLLAEFSAYEEQQKKIKKMREAIKRLRDWANRSNPPSAGLHRRATNMERALERMEKLKRPNLNPQRINLNFEMNDRSGRDVITIDNISKSYNGVQLFSNLSLAIKYKENSAIVGKNGTGKSTILKMIIGEETPDNGVVKIGSNVKIGYLSQNPMVEYSDFRVIEAFRDGVPETEGNARHILAKFLFFGNSVFQKVKDLSGGERIRLKLAQLMYQDINLLILDEPTNHLDIESREILEEALEQFDGTIICVSHDRYFLNRLFKTIYWFENSKDYNLVKYLGSYEEVKEKHNRRIKESILNVESMQSKEMPVKNMYQSEIRDNKLAKIEAEIEKLEVQITELDQRLFEEMRLDELLKLSQDRQQLQNLREGLYLELAQLEKN